MPTETGITREQIINELNKSVHGKLDSYIPVFGQACLRDAEFCAHLIAFDFVNGQIKDSKLALPVITLGTNEFPDELVENSLAHLALQPPRELLKAVLFAIDYPKIPSRRKRALENTVRRYLRAKEVEPGKWMRLAARHRKALKGLYKLSHSNMPDWARTALFGEIHGHKVAYAPGSIFADIANLSQMPAPLVAATIQKWHLSPLIVSGAMAGAKAKQSDSAVVQAGMDQMSDTELINRSASLERKGLAKNEVLKSTFRKKVAKAATSKKATLKTSVAAEEMEDEGLRSMLKELQERQIQNQKNAGRGIEGNWLVIIDKSGSQTISIELGKQVAAAIAKFVTGKVIMVFCDTSVTGMDVTGMELAAIQKRAQYISANGGTSYGVGLEWATRETFDGIAIVGDGAENQHPFFSTVYAAYAQAIQKRPPVYLYQTASTESYMACRAFQGHMDGIGVPVTVYDMTHGMVDYYSLSNTVQTMNANRFGLVDKILLCPLLTLNEVLPVSAERKQIVFTSA